VVDLKRRGFLFGAAAVLAVPKRTLFLPPRGGWNGGWTLFGPGLTFGFDPQEQRFGTDIVSEFRISSGWNPQFEDAVLDIDFENNRAWYGRKLHENFTYAAWKQLLAEFPDMGVNDIVCTEKEETCESSNSLPPARTAGPSALDRFAPRPLLLRFLETILESPTKERLPTGSSSSALPRRQMLRSTSTKKSS
jgi:hypothetical protein